jgi:hypothetical protein
MKQAASLSRVTKLVEFSPVGYFFKFRNLKQIQQLPKIGLLLYVQNLTSLGVGDILGNFQSPMGDFFYKKYLATLPVSSQAREDLIIFKMCCSHRNLRAGLGQDISQEDPTCLVFYNLILP